MSSNFPDWLQRLLTHGESSQLSAPAIGASDRASAVAQLREAHGVRALSLAGPAPAFSDEIAWQAARLLAGACWRLIGEAGADPLPTMAPSPAAADHFSADLTLRFLPGVYRRANTRADLAPLATALESVLRRWPLSGVLADLDGEPTTVPDFDAHFGLQLLYAERLLKTSQPGWIPESGTAREWAERVFRERGRSLPARPNSEDDDRA